MRNNAYDIMNERLDRYTEYVQFLKSRTDREQLEKLSSLRGFTPELIDKHDIFWIGRMQELLVPDFLDDIQHFGIISPTNNKPIYHDRWIIPIKDTNGKVQNLVGYSNVEDERYVYGTGTYYSRKDTLYGLENYDLAYELGWCIVTEGITDTLSIRQLGYPNTFSMCGTMRSEKKMEMLNRLRHGVIFIPDRDKAGDNTRNHWKVNRYFIFHTPIKYKDADETLNEKEYDTKEWFKECMDIAIDWIRSDEHNGRQCPYREETML